MSTPNVLRGQGKPNVLLSKTAILPKGVTFASGILTVPPPISFEDIPLLLRRFEANHAGRPTTVPRERR